MKTQKLPTFDSMQQASIVAGVPLATLRRAKRNGSPGFDHGRVSLKPVLTWLFTSGVNVAKLSPFESLAQARAERERFKLRKDEGAFFDKNEVTEYVQKVFVTVREQILAMPGQMAAAVNPADPVHAQKILESYAEQFLKHCRDAVPQKPPSADNSKPSNSPEDGADEPQTGDQQKIK